MFGFSKKTRQAGRTSSAVIESLEGRQFLSATITGATIHDITGNGASAGDKRQAGITVELYQDVNKNGVIDSADGAAFATTVSNKSGAFKFTKVPFGSYLMKESLPENMVQTTPMLTNVYTIEAAKKKTYAGHKFYNYVKNFDATQVTNVSYVINGTNRVTDLRLNVKEGDTVRVEFTLLSTQTVTLASYRTTNPNGIPLSDQKLYDKAGGVALKAGTYALEVQIPKSYFQVDFVGGVALDKFGLTASNVNYTNQDRLLGADMGGTKVLATGRGVVTFVKTMNKKWHGVYELVEEAFVQKKK